MKLVTTLAWDRSLVADALGMNHDALNSFIADGRCMNKIVQASLITDLNADTRAVTGGAQILVLENGREYVVRCLTKHSGVSFMPSYMKGHGRSYKAPAFRDWLGDFDGFLVPNITDWPAVDVYQLSAREVLQLFDNGNYQPELTFNQFLYLIDNPHLYKTQPQPFIHLAKHAKAS